MPTREEIKNGTLNQIIVSDGGLKEAVVDYVGDKIQPENDEVTLEMIIGVLAEEFPELVLAIAEENFLRGYSTGLDDSLSAGIQENK